MPNNQALESELLRRRTSSQTTDPNLRKIGDGVDQMTGGGIVDLLRRLLAGAPTSQQAPPPEDDRDFVIIPPAPPRQMMQPFDMNDLNFRGRDAEKSFIPHDPNDPNAQTEMDRMFNVDRDWSKRDSPEAQKKARQR